MIQSHIMEQTHLFLISSLSLVTLMILFFKFLTPKKLRNLAPSPPSVPIFGHLHLIIGPLHRLLHQLSSKYGPVMSLRFGSRPVLVITSSKAAQECFTKNDVILANRPLLLSGKYLQYDNTTIGSAPYSPLWRDLRRMNTLELFSTARLKDFTESREDEVRLFIKDLIQDVGNEFKIVKMKSRIQGLLFNILTRIIADKRFYGIEVEGFEEERSFMEVISDAFEVSETSNLGEFIPVLKWIDFQGVKKRYMELQTKIDGFAQRLVEERRSKRRRSLDEGKAKTLIDAMLSLQESKPDHYTDTIIKGNATALLLAGTDTSSATIEWAMALLLNHPNVLERARSEIDEYTQNKRLLQESDLPNLPYIQCIVNETMRLFPAGPLLVPHEPSEDCMIGGFDVPRGTMVLVNAWAIHRDLKEWDDPLSFKPERFEGARNEAYRFIPFGMGRRQCPGSGLANQVVSLGLGSLIQCFEWERISQELVDLSEKKGLTLHKDKPLEALCKARQKMSHVLMEL